MHLGNCKCQGRQYGHAHRLTTRPQHDQTGKFVANIRCGPIVPRVVETKVCVVNRGFAPAPKWKFVARKIGRRDSNPMACPACFASHAPSLFEQGIAGEHVMTKLVGSSSGTGFDIIGSSGRSVDILINDTTRFGCQQDSAMAICIAGDVRDDMATGPTWQTRRLTNLGIGQRLQFGFKNTVGGDCSVNFALQACHCSIVVRRGHAMQAGHLSARDVAKPFETWQPFSMQIAMVGLGRMGANMVRRLMRDGQTCVVYDINPEAVKALQSEGAIAADSPEAVIATLESPRHIWLMVPAAYVASTIEKFAPLLSPGDTLIDGGNSWYRDDVDRAAPLAEKGINYLDVGTSGGVYGLDRGYCLMVGGKTEAVQQMSSVFDTLAPGVGEIPRTPGRSGELPTEERGWLHCGPVGAGHFVKMIHNGIEYGMMAAYAEGLNVLAKANIGRADAPKDAETAPLADAHYYQYDFDLAAVTEVWRRGSVVTSWLLDLTAQALHADPTLDAYQGVVSDSGEGRWTVHAAVDEGVPVPVLAASLWDRFYSRERGDVAHKVLSAMRAGFGGHVESKS